MVVLITQSIIAIAPSCAGYTAYSNIGLHAHPTSDPSDAADDVVTTASQQERTLAAPRAVRRTLCDQAVPLVVILELFAPVLGPRLSAINRGSLEVEALHQREIYLRHAVLRI